MKLLTSTLRTLDHLEYSLNIRASKHLALILIKDFEITFAGNMRTAKDALIQKYNEETDNLLLAWPGQYSQDIFVVTKKDLEKHYHSSL